MTRYNWIIYIIGMFCIGWAICYKLDTANNGGDHGWEDEL
jgi:hypothetical protein